MRRGRYPVRTVPLQCGAIRILDMGNLPFTPEIKAYHKAKIEERAKAEKRNASFQMVTDDVYAISKGRLVGRPKA